MCPREPSASDRDLATVPAVKTSSEALAEIGSDLSRVKSSSADLGYLG